MSAVSDRFTEKPTITPPATVPGTPLSEYAQRALFGAVGTPPPEIAAIGQSYGRRVAEIQNDSRFTPEAKRQMKDEEQSKARAQFEAAFDKQHRETQLRELRKEEGSARAALRSDPPVLDVLATDNDRAKLQFRQQHEANTLKRVELDLRELDAASDVQEVADVFEESAAVGGENFRRVGRHAIRRAAALLTAARRATPGGRESSPDSPDHRRVADMRGRYDAWTKANPTAAQRLRRTLDQQAVIESKLASQRDRWRVAYGL
jgi:hypothetical protein